MHGVNEYHFLLQGITHAGLLFWCHLFGSTNIYWAPALYQAEPWEYQLVPLCLPICQDLFVF